CIFFFSSRRRHTRSKRDWSSDVCSSDLKKLAEAVGHRPVAKRLEDRPEQRAGTKIRYDNNPFIKKIYSGGKAVIAELDPPFDGKIGRASCRERGWSWVAEGGAKRTAEGL